jgi:coenzyme PQQ precursor peptide PqqA
MFAAQGQGAKSPQDLAEERVALLSASSYVTPTAVIVPRLWRTLMVWKCPKIVEVSVGMEINMYACAVRK